MAKGRKQGCPVNIKNWLIEILDVSTSGYVRIYGLNSMTKNIESDTEDGSASTSTWEEPYKTKLRGSISLEGEPIITASTGAEDAGQSLLNWYAEQAGCDGDATLKFTDPYGHSWIGDYIVTSAERSSDEDEEGVSWDLEQVGEVEPQPYVSVSSITIKDGSQSAATLSLTTASSAKVLTVDFTPATSSNKRFRISNSNRNVIAISDITETGFTVTPIGVGTSTITVTTVNGAKTATSAVTVTAGA